MNKDPCQNPDPPQAENHAGGELKMTWFSKMDLGRIK